MPGRKLLTVSEIAEMAQVALPTVSNWIRRFDDFPAGRSIDGSKRLRYDQVEVEEWLARRNFSRRGVGSLNGLERLERELRRDALGTLFIVLQSLPTREQASEEEVLDRYSQLAQGGASVPLSFDLRTIQDILPQLIQSYGSLSPTEMADVLGSLEDSNDNRGGAETSTPDVLVEFLGALTLKTSGAVVDLASGQGRILEHLASRKIGTRHRGIEINANNVLRARQIASLRGLSIVYEVSDGLAPIDARSASLVLVDPPLGIGTDRGHLTKYSWDFLEPVGQDIATGFMVRALEALEPDGRALIVTRADLLHRGGTAAEFRRQLLQMGAIRGIVALPARLRANTSIPLAVWILGYPRPDIDSVVMVDASLSDENDLRSDGPVVRAIRAEFDHDAVNRDENYAASVPVLELLTKEVSLRPNAWVSKKRDLIEPQEQLAVARRELKSLSQHVSALPVVGSELEVGFTEPPLTSLQALVERGDIKIVRAIPSKASEEGLGAPVLEPRILREGLQRDQAKKLLSPETPAVAVEPGDIVVTTDPRGVRATVWHEAGWVAGLSLQLIRVKGNKINPEFLCAAIEHPRNLAHIDPGAFRVQANIRGFEVPDLPREQQARLAKVLSAAVSAERELKTRLAEISESRKKLSIALGSGTVSVNREDIET